MKKIFFRSDDHFNNYNVNKHCNRPFLHNVVNNEIYHKGQIIEKCLNHDEALKKSINMTVKNMNEEFITLWNEQVRDEDVLYYVGDFAFPCNVMEGIKLVKKLNGYKILILGNHDKSKKVMLEMGFSEVYDQHEITIEGTKVLLSHYPYIRNDVKNEWIKKIPQYTKKKPEDTNIVLDMMKTNPSLSDLNYLLTNKNKTDIECFITFFFNANLNYNESNKKIINLRNRLYNVLVGTKLIDNGDWLIHGHTHSKTKIMDKMINVCSDAWDYRCVPEETISQIINGVFNE